MIIGTDTINPNTNLFRFFILTSLGEGNDILRFNTQNYQFPLFDTPINNYKIEIPTTDGTIISSTKTISTN